MIVNDIQLSADLEDILAELQKQLKLRGIELLEKTKNTGTDIMVQCPYHAEGKEKKPSAGIRKSDGQFHCFACGETHSLPEVISHCFGYYQDMIGSFGTKWLMKNFSASQLVSRKPIQLNLGRGQEKQEEIKYVTDAELDKYRYYHGYWAERGIESEELIELFDLGYDKETECITFPIRDIDGNCLFVARRSVKTKYFNYPQGVEKPLYGLYELNKLHNEYRLDIRSTSVIVCESMLDALIAWQYGAYAVAMNGTGNSLVYKQLNELPCRRLILATDKDDAGMEARKRLRKNVRGKLITEFDYATYPRGAKDLNDMTEDEFNRLEEVF